MKLELEQKEITMILQIIGNAPYNQIAHVIQKIANQMQKENKSLKEKDE